MKKNLVISLGAISSIGAVVTPLSINASESAKANQSLSENDIKISEINTKIDMIRIAMRRDTEELRRRMSDLEWKVALIKNKK